MCYYSLLALSCRWLSVGKAYRSNDQQSFTARIWSRCSIFDWVYWCYLRTWGLRFHHQCFGKSIHIRWPRYGETSKTSFYQVHLVGFPNHSLLWVTWPHNLSGHISSPNVVRLHFSNSPNRTEEPIKYSSGMDELKRLLHLSSTTLHDGDASSRYHRF